jgi:hypothetical protein
MKIQWITKDDSLGAVTIYDNNIRLSKKAADYFVDAYAIAIGVDVDENKIVIKKVNKEEAESNTIDKSRLYKIHIKPSYGRITGKKMIDELKYIYKFDFTKQPAYKFSAKWNTGDKMLIVDVKEGTYA